MELPLQISFRQMAHSPEIEKIVREKAAKLDHFADHIMSCRVVVEMLGKHRAHGNQYEVRVDVTVAGGEVVASRECSEHIEYKNIHTAIRDAFDSVRRQLEDHVRRQRGFVKTHEETPHARVNKLFPQEGYGFIQAADGHEVYFHRNSVLHDAFDRLAIGSEVSFIEEEGRKGPQASTVKMC